MGGELGAGRAGRARLALASRAKTEGARCSIAEKGVGAREARSALSAGVSASRRSVATRASRAAGRGDEAKSEQATSPGATKRTAPATIRVIQSAGEMAARTAARKGRASDKSNQLVKLLINSALLLGALLAGPETPGRRQLVAPWSVEAVSVRRLSVPDLVVIDQENLTSQARPPPARTGAQSADYGIQAPQSRAAAANGSAAHPSQRRQPEAASLITSQLADQHGQQQQQQQQMIATFECLVSYDKRKDRNLIVKWHHDERGEPIYQWIPELNKRSISPQYRPFIQPIVGEAGGAAGDTPLNESNQTHQEQLTLEAGFRLVRPTKELGGKYTCSAISSQNDDSKSKKMIVYTPPRSFNLSASRANLGALFASQRDRLIQLTQPSMAPTAAGATLMQAQQQQLPLAYRMRGLEGVQVAQATTITPQMLSTIDYVNVNQQRARLQQQQQQQLQQQFNNWHQQQPSAPTPANRMVGSHPMGAPGLVQRRQPQGAQLGLKLVCDIDQVFPVPEVSIYRLAKPDGAHPERLAKLDTRIERDPRSGLFRVQVTSVLDDDELQAVRRPPDAGPQAQQEQAPGEVHFECLIALTNLELGRYADNRRSLVYRPGAIASGQQGAAGDNESLVQVASGGPTGGPLQATIAALLPLLALIVAAQVAAH